MPVTVERLPDTSIILASYGGKVTLDDALKVFSESAAYMQEIDGHAYRISDFTYAASDFAEVMKILKVATQKGEGYTNDPNISVIFVGKTTWARLYKNAMSQSQYGGVHIPMVQTLEDAFEFIDAFEKKRTSSA